MPHLLASELAELLPQSAGEVKHWRHLHGSAASLAVAEMAHQLPVVYICAEAAHTQRVKRELQFFLSPKLLPCLAFPDRECLPYDRVSPHPDLVSQRLLAMSQLGNLQHGVVVVPITALMQRLVPQDYLLRHSFVLKTGDELVLDSFRQRLQRAGYYSVTQVMSPGEYAIRGGLIDVFPAGSSQPFRLDLFDTIIEGIRLFETESQRSTERLESVSLLPAREFPLDPASIQTFRQAWRANLDGDPSKAQVYREVSKGLAPAGCENYLPLFFNHTSTLFDYLPDNALWVLEDGCMEAATTLSTEIVERHESAQLSPEWPPLAAGLLYQSVDEIYAGLKHFRRVQLLSLNLENKKHLIDFKIKKGKQFKLHPRAENPWQEFVQHLKSSSTRKLLVAESKGRRESLLGILKSNELTCQLVDTWQEFLNDDAQLALTVADVDRGMLLLENNVELITESQLYGERGHQRRQRRSAKNRDPDAIIRSLAELHLGDPIVHEEHGVGRYQGLETLNIGGDHNEYATVEYKDGDKIYVPVLSLDLVSRYVGGSPESAPLHKMGGQTWVKLRNKAREKAYDMATELLEVQALRMAREGHAFPPLDHSYEAFAAGFAFEETADQLQVIDDVINDMTSPEPMDRLVCGDVGFGKTEIALRAAFMAISGNKQVVILVPTTLLAQQHYNSFADRFADWPVKIELISRFRSASALRSGIQGMANGTVDIAIGTHKLLQNQVQFRNLGLMIIDEEHRFGVRQKERLKKLRSEVDILTLTATPIPRTLNFALSGLRDISVIATPPRARLAVKTFVREWDDGLLKEAMMREIRRGGQIYFLHNEVQTIEKVQHHLEELVPEATARIGHGQMRESELEQVMRDFYHQRFNLLICTTIIESGIDVPTANTIVINRADRFGLAQLHQLRGRVGRSHHQAYAYMITPDLGNMTADAKKRLIAIESLDTLGAGFALASQDLEIRGAGELLGESQSGMIDQVGYSLYNRYLEQAITSIQRQRKPDDMVRETGNIEINLHIPARFADDYIPDVHLRLNMYQRIANATNKEALHELQIETIDRFGLMVDSGKNLFRIAELKLRARQYDIKSIEVGPNAAIVDFHPQPRIDVPALMQLVSGNASEYKLVGAETLQISRATESAEQRLSLVHKFLDQIKPYQ